MIRAGGLAVSLVLLVGLAAAGPSPANGSEIYLNMGEIQGRKNIRSLYEIRQEKTVRQKWDYSCGSAALATVLTHHYGDNTSEAVIVTTILRITDPIKIRNRGGFSLFDLKRFVESRGYQAKGFAGMTLEELVDMKVPGIVPVKSKGLDHFVVFRGIRGDRAVLSDPAFGTVTMRVDRFVSIWKGGVGFFVTRPGAESISGGLEPRLHDMLIPDGGGIGRAANMSPTPLTRFR